MRHDGVIEPYVKTFQVRKLNKRLHIWCVEDDRSVYTPPDFLRHLIRNREGMQALADRFCVEWQEPIRAIMEFEASLRPDKSIQSVLTNQIESCR